MIDVNKNVEDHHINDQVKLLLYPEALEVSNVSNILSDELTFKVDELFSLKEVQKLVSSKENLIEILKEIETEGVIKLSDQQEATILLNEEFTLYNFLNLPNGFSRNQMIELLHLKEGDYKRIYKQALYWILVSENSEFNNSAEKLFKTIKIEDASLKYDITSSKTVKKQILRKIQHHSYIKETDDLKASSPSNPRKDDSFQRGTHALSGHKDSEHFSWRKRSDNMSTNSKEENKKENAKNVTSFNTNTSKFRRDRFNSDPHDKSIKEYPQYTAPLQEIEIKINPELVNYSLTISHRYSVKEMLEFYEKIKENLTKNQTEFQTYVEEVCELKPKEVMMTAHTLVPTPITVAIPVPRKNSGDGYKDNYSHHYDHKSPQSNYNPSGQKDKIFIPRNNPLQDMNLNK